VVVDLPVKCAARLTLVPVLAALLVVLCLVERAAADHY
jgi:hypothetical protein